MQKQDFGDETLELPLIDDCATVESAVKKSWSKIAPFWPLKNLIAVNPIAGFEDLPFKEALVQAKAYFQQTEMPAGMQEVNRQSIKWLQAFFDEGQATIKMPFKNAGLFKSTLSLIRFDSQIHQNDEHKINWIKQQPNEPEAFIASALSYLKIEQHDWDLFLSLMLTTLPGWAAHIQYKANWAAGSSSAEQSEYLAFRLALTCLIWPDAKKLINWHKNALNSANQENTYNDIFSAELSYQYKLLKQFGDYAPPQEQKKPKAQMVFCIDVRSEPFRRAIEAQGNYATYGFAGFFGLPVSISNPVTHESYASCPVLLKPAYNVAQTPDEANQSNVHKHNRLTLLKKLYQSLKYTFTTPFNLVETVGSTTGLWMFARTLAPRAADAMQAGLKKTIAPDFHTKTDVRNIPLSQQIGISANALKMIGLTENFSPMVVFCGHGSATVNNTFSTALDCGACGGRHGGPNARALAEILNSKAVRFGLSQQGINIPDETFFAAAEHNTTTDDVEIYINEKDLSPTLSGHLKKLREALKAAQISAVQYRGGQIPAETANGSNLRKSVARRSTDWAEVRPEWGLAGNASFIIGPRWLTENINLEGRSFLHSYEWQTDNNGSLLTSILTAPMVVGQWINAQYLFSTLDNVAFGAGSKITNNITGKIGVMQGNASDLMHGLPLQSVFATDTTPYHTTLRLTVVVYAPKETISGIIAQQAILQKLFGNGWLHMICLDPTDHKKYRLVRDLGWTHIN